MSFIASVSELETHYGAPGEASLIKEVDHLTTKYRVVVETAKFCTLATTGPEGIDCSPRGDAEPVVRIADDRTLLLPDWRGNNRIDSLRNIVEDPRVALMFMVPGWNNVLRINGSAKISVDRDLLASFEMEGKHPRSVIVIAIKQVYFQCARALMRSDLWNPDQRIDPNFLPKPGHMMQEIKAAFDGAQYDKDWPGRANASMW
ncbi:pyridoxine biosynthesis protein [Roseibium aquae]|uniref:Pyridoxine biosynthesis protein n=1 Tax=Roseibium aquae TaxID=1323746 RepID=A0A916TGR5_9HYPH|nr:pyridoxamine 5'-phosphate oxidase family protein [Roseibium aquae]GGB44299.1 pyridoxine biosynthesis protein [Roseibium aquae]